jgi:hypothetical protein
MLQIHSSHKCSKYCGSFSTQKYLAAMVPPSDTTVLSEHSASSYYTRLLAPDFAHTLAEIFGVDMFASSQAKQGITPARGESLLASIAKLGLPIEVGLNRAAFCMVSLILVHTRAVRIHADTCVHFYGRMGSVQLQV